MPPKQKPRLALAAPANKRVIGEAFNGRMGSVTKKTAPQHSVRLEIENNRIAQHLVGPNSEHLKTLERLCDVDITHRSTQLTIIGSHAGVQNAEEAIKAAISLIKKGHGDTFDMRSLVRHADNHITPSTELKTLKGPVFSRSPNQTKYIEQLFKHEMVFGVGPAGTGKTWIAVVYAASLLQRGEVDRIIISRPAVEAGERLGFLPGDMKEKVDPYMRPIYDALNDCYQAGKVEEMIGKGALEIAPLAFMRGRTLARAVCILDEAQNTTPAQMKMFLTRMGEDSRMIITGDPSQIDLPQGQKSGLVEALEILKGIPEIGVTTFGENDVVRHALVGRIVQAYNKADGGQTQQPSAPRRRGPA